MSILYLVILFYSIYIHINVLMKPSQVFLIIHNQKSISISLVSEKPVFQALPLHCTNGVRSEILSGCCEKYHQHWIISEHSQYYIVFSQDMFSQFWPMLSLYCLMSSFMIRQLPSPIKSLILIKPSRVLWCLTTPTCHRILEDTEVRHQMPKQSLLNFHSVS